MIRHQDNKIIFNEQVSFELPQRICIDPHPETCPSENELHLIAPDKSFKLVIAFLTVDKSAKEFTAEIYEERESVNIVHPLTEIETPSGIKGWATRFEYDNEEVEEITLDIPVEPHSLLNLHFWHIKFHFDAPLYAVTQRTILRSVRLFQNNSSQHVESFDEEKNLKQFDLSTNKRKRGRQPYITAYIQTIYFPGCIARVHIPETTEEGYKRQMERIKEAAAKLLYNVERREREAQEKQQE